MTIHPGRLAASFLVSILWIAGCTSTEVITANSRPAIQATGSIPYHDLLDIGILPLAPGIPTDPEVLEKSLILPDVRRAESIYIAYHLKDTLELTGNWGAVRVTPVSSNTVDLELKGSIRLSDGEQLAVRMEARDATGKLWFSNDYTDNASKYSYGPGKEDPFQDLYNDIANDLLMAQRKLSREQIARIKTVAELKYAEDLAPDAFDDYIKEEKGTLSVVRLPARDDSMMERVSRIREQEDLFVDTLDDHYGRFFREMRVTYDEWRHATYDEAIRLKQLERQARNRLLGGALLIAGGIAIGVEDHSRATGVAAAGAVAGGIRAIRSGLQRKKEAEIHAESLKELSYSMGSEISPYILDIEGKTIELTGSANQQYEQWRALLKEIHLQETGLPRQ